MTAASPATLGQRVRGASTPTRLRVFLYAAWAIAGLLFLVGESAVLEAAHAMKTVGHDAAPSIIAAEEISSALADLDANAANYLLGNAWHQASATKAFEKQRAVVTSKLVTAAENITYGEAERQPIGTLLDGLGRYLERVAEMRYRKDTGDVNGAVVAYTAASDVMHREMLPAADRLDQANYKQLDVEYKSQGAQSEDGEVAAAVVAAGLVSLLLWAQLFLFRRFRRVLNVPLVAATALALGFGVYLVRCIDVAREDLRVAKEDCFESIRPLWQARAIAYDANGDESRWLLDRAHAETLDQAYRDKLRKLASIPRPDEAIITARKVPAQYQGLFATELRNVTFPGERDAVLEMVRAFTAYDTIDGKIRGLEQNDHHAEAIQLCIGAGAQESNAAFDRFDKALLKVVKINHDVFDRTVSAGERDLRVAESVLPVVSLLVAALALLGIRMRLREYAA